jgi:hypothetical protein
MSMSAPPLTIDAGGVEAIVEMFNRLDAAEGIEATAALACRILKITEEAGEAAQAFIGMTGQNPRKGVTHNRADLCAEICDVVLASLVTLASVDPGRWTSTFADHVAKVVTRTLNAGGGRDGGEGGGGAAAAPEC